MAYEKGYFEIQVEFAKAVAEILRKPLTEVLLSHTSFYKTFRIPDWKFDTNNIEWKSFISKLSQSKDWAETAYQFYLQQIKKYGAEKQKELFGCFSYEYIPKEKIVYIHFRNTDTPEPGALSKERLITRVQELHDMFAAIKKNHPDAMTVAGSSWLYNLVAYKRLFPPQYTATMVRNITWFRSTALWGQFLDSSGILKPELVQEFNSNMKHAKSLEQLVAAFPFPILEPKADIIFFYQYYNSK